MFTCSLRKRAIPLKPLLVLADLQDDKKHKKSLKKTYIIYGNKHFFNSKGLLVLAELQTKEKIMSSIPGGWADSNRRPWSYPASEGLQRYLQFKGHARLSIVL